MQASKRLFYEFTAPFYRPAIKNKSLIAMNAPLNEADKSAKQEVDRRRAADNSTKTWFILAVMAFILSAVFYFASIYTLGSAKPGITLAVALWAGLFAWLLTFKMPPKIVSGLFGALFAGGSQNAVTGDGFISSVQDHTGTALKVLGFLSIDQLQDGKPFITAMVWLFFGIVAVICFPSFFVD